MPGRLLLVDTKRGEVIKDEELKHSISTQRPVAQWLNDGIVSLKDIHNAYNKIKGLPAGTVSVTQRNPLNISIHQDRRLPAFGYSVEDISMLVLPMIRNRFVHLAKCCGLATAKSNHFCGNIAYVYCCKAFDP